MPKIKYFKPVKHARKERAHLRRAREIRDIYDRLRPLYATGPVTEFIVNNYFISKEHIWECIRASDSKEVDLSQASIAYLTVMKPGFRL